MIASRKLALGVAGALALGLCASEADAISRDEVLVRAKAFAYHPWTCTGANLTASCDGGYHSVYLTGDYLGLPYDWGGYMTLFQFDQQIASGHGAGSYPDDGVLDCTSGLDCSGFVSKAWGTGHFTTSSLGQIGSPVSKSSMLPGDIFNQAGYHTALFSRTLGNGDPVLYESVGYNVHYSTPGWSWVDGYTPLRYDNISGSSAGNPEGTPNNPIVIGSFPYTDARNTSASPSDLLDGCGASPGKNESGPEYVYQVTLSSPGTLSVMVQDDVGVDIDVHIYTSMNTSDCVARDDTALSYPVDCGTYYVVADTFKGSVEYPGAYSLTVDFTPTGGGCGSGPPGYSFNGGLGEACAYPGHENLPFCNPNLGASTCLYSSNDSFCSKPCSANAECGELPGGCCADIGNGELYCLTAELCGSSGGPGPGTGGGGPGPGGDPGGGGNGPGSGAGGGTGLGGSSSGTGPSASGSSHSASGDESGCALAPASRPGSAGGWWWLAALALGIRARRRRRRKA